MRHILNGVVGEDDTLPGCTQIVVSHSVWLPESERGKGNGQKAHEQRLEMFRHMGYDVAICTVDVSNTAQMKILLKNGWVKSIEFKSSKTGHQVALMYCELKPTH